MTVDQILAENRRRREELTRPFDPIAGDPADPTRFAVTIRGLEPESIYIPVSQRTEPLTAQLIEHGDIDTYLRAQKRKRDKKSVELLIQQFDRERIRHDFPFWAAKFVKIKAKGGGDEINFILNRPQRILVERLEQMRRAGRPIRLVLLKARQWGGSTCVQLYMAWLQLTQALGLNSLIVAQQGMATDEIKDMFDRMLINYPDWLLTDEDGNPVQGRRLETVGQTRSLFRVVGRKCKIKLGSAERPDSSRGGDYNLVHCSEVALWPKARYKNPDDLMRAATSGVLLAPNTMIVLESTANGTGNYFHREYEAARTGNSQYRALFIAWHQIEKYTLPVPDERQFAQWLLDGRDAENAPNDREQPGKYLWSLWQKGVTLQALNWFVAERRKYSDHGQMASEYPSDDTEAFVHSGARVFDHYKVEALRPGCRLETMRGEIDGDALSGERCLDNLRFTPSQRGMLKIWRDRELPSPGTMAYNRYLTVVDIGGRGERSDFTVIAVFDRNGMDRGALPEIVAQWRGHDDIDIVAWTALRIAAYYDNSLLVIESNTLETRDPDRLTDGDQSHYILNQLRDVYPNLYARRQSEEAVLRGEPTRYGFHTNTATKPMIISGLIKVIREGLYIERDEECLKEYLTYEQRQNGSYGALTNCHDDILMTRAIGLHICFNEMEMPVTGPASRKARSRNSFEF